VDASPRRSDRRSPGPDAIRPPDAPAPHALVDALFLRSPLSTVIYDAAGRVVAVNPAYIRRTGRSAADIPRDYSILADRELERRGVLPLVRRAFAGEDVTLPPLRFAASSPDGGRATAWLRAHLHPVRDASGPVTHVILVHIDLTVQTVEPAPPDTARSRLLAMMSHDLRTPLNAILGYAGLLGAGIAGPVTADQAIHLDRIAESARELAHLVETVHTFARLDTGDDEVSPEDTDVVRLVHEAVAAIRPSAERRGLALDVSGAGTAQLATDAGKVRQIVVNLLWTAMRRSAYGTIRAEVADGADHVLVRISDTGMDLDDGHDAPGSGTPTGIEAVVARLVDGAGLGLSVSAGLARLLDGEVTVESRTAAGTTFLLRLPRSPALQDRLEAAGD
jgi:signal transduction histidine kinase